MQSLCALPVTSPVTMRVAVMITLYGLGSHVVYVANGGGGEGGGGDGSGGDGSGAALKIVTTRASDTICKISQAPAPDALKYSSGPNALIAMAAALASFAVHTKHSWHTADASNC